MTPCRAAQGMRHRGGNGVGRQNTAEPNSAHDELYGTMMNRLMWSG